MVHDSVFGVFWWRTQQVCWTFGLAAWLPLLQPGDQKCRDSDWFSSHLVSGLSLRPGYICTQCVSLSFLYVGCLFLKRPQSIWLLKEAAFPPHYPNAFMRKAVEYFYWSSESVVGRGGMQLVALGSVLATLHGRWPFGTDSLAQDTSVLTCLLQTESCSLFLFHFFLEGFQFIATSPKIHYLGKGKLCAWILEASSA